jgi:hypothetical protein
MVVALLALTGLITLGSLTVLSVQGGMATAGHDRFQALALYAAESGAAAAVDYLRRTYRGTSGRWSEFVHQNNDPIEHPTGIPGNKAGPTSSENLFTSGMQTWYDVAILNNLDDPGLKQINGPDLDGRVIIRSTGYGPNGTVAQVELEIQAPINATGAAGRPCPSYGQRGMDSDGAGRNDCLTNVVGTDSAIYRPGDVP